jgi:hypothetical protein
MRPAISVRRTPVKDKLRLFSLYVDFPASVRVRWITNVIARLVGPSWLTSSEMWKTDSLVTNQSVQQMTISDATKADVIIIAASSLTQREPVLTQWLDSVAAGKPNRSNSGLFIGLLGDTETKVGKSDWSVRSMMRCARQLKRDFLWQWMGINAMNDSTWLADPIQHLLDCKQALKKQVVLQ